MNLLLRWILELRYAHACAGVEAMRQDIAGSQAVTRQQQAAFALMQARSLAIYRRLQALRRLESRRVSA